MTYALDTNTIIHLLCGNSVTMERYETALSSSNRIVIPPVVNYEMWRGFLYKPAAAKERAYDKIRVRCHTGEMTVAIWYESAQIYAKLRNEGKMIEDADILIAAFSVVGEHTLVTGNTKHFQRIDGLRLENWAESC